MPIVKKLPKWAIRQAGGINKKAWALARRGKGRKMSKAKPRKAPRRRSTPRSVGEASHSNNSKPGIGSWFKTGRTIDVFSGPAQGSLARFGPTQEAGTDALDRYSGGAASGNFAMEKIQPVAGGIGTGLLRNWLRSKLGVYRGVGQKKILSIVMAANPEILATAEINPTDDIGGWNDIRVSADRGYVPRENSWSLDPGFRGQRFWTSIGFDAGLKITQKLAEHFLNPILPPGYNL